MIIRTALVIILILSSLKSYTQCNANVPNFVVNLSSDPNGVYTSPDTNRSGYCCGATGAVRCVSFEVTLHPDAEGVLFEIVSGALPGGALFYQINCGAQQNIGTPICLSGIGPHQITFCKPGGNTNTYRITSVAEPDVDDSIAVNDGCSGSLGTIGYDPSSITWTTIFPGPRGSYNSYLSCVRGCDTSLVTAQPGYPPYIDVEVCGFPFGGCDTLYSCDTARVNFYSTLDVTINPLEPTVCFGSLGTTITAIPQGGSPPYVYNWNNGATGPSIFVDTGTYIVELGDISGCPPTYDTVVVTSFSSVIEAIAGTDINACYSSPNTTLNGSVIAAGGGTWIGNGSFTPSTDSLNATYVPTAAELLAGKSIIKLLTTGNGSCPADSDTVEIFYNEFDAVYIIGTTPASCKGDSDGTAFTNITGNASPFSVLWSNAEITDTINNLTAGIYGVRIMDSLGCFIDTTAEVIQADSALQLIMNLTAVTCFGESNGAAGIHITGGFPPYLITYDPLLPPAVNDSISGIPAGTYTLTISDSTNCVIDTSFEIIGPIAPLNSNLVVNDVTCQNGSDGSISANITGGIAPYSYLWDLSTGSQTTQTATGLTIGTYTVVITDSLGCQIIDSAVVIEPTSPIVYADTTTSPSCTGASDGTATVFPSGGTPPYTFLWDTAAGSQTTQTAIGLSAGFYTVTIFDSNTCLTTQPIEVTDPPLLFVLNTVVENVSCYGNSNGSAIVTPVGGVPPYTFQWGANANFSTDSAVYGLGPGSYTITVYDQNNCIILPAVIISQPSDSISSTTSSIITSCRGGSDGIAIASVSGGTAPYTYLWDINGSSQLTDSAFNLSPGTYEVTITDSLNCIKTDSVVVNEPDSFLNVSFYIDNVNCKGDSNGIAAVFGSGTGPVSIQWGANGGFSTSDTILNLVAGTYNVQLNDTFGCSIDTFVNILEPAAPLLLDINSRAVACYNGNDGFAWVNASGGTAPYRYYWDSLSGFQITDTAFNLAAGTYAVTVADSNGCLRDTSVSVIQPNSPLALSASSIPVRCYGSTDGKAIVNVNGGFTPYSYQWGTNAGSQMTDTASGLAPGTYMITVSDSLGCADNLAVTVGEPDSLTIAIVTKNLDCFNDSSGAATANVSGGSPPFTYLWTKGSFFKTGQNVTGLKSLKYYVTAIDRFGCQVNDSVFPGEPSEVMITTSGIDTICPGETITISASASGGKGFHTFSWGAPLTGITSSQIVSPKQNSLYIVQAIDSAGCRSEYNVINIYINTYEGDSLDLVSDDEICEGDTASILALHNARFKNYIYEWTRNGKLISNNPGPVKVSPDSTSFYVFNITNECGGTLMDSVEVIVNPKPQLNLPEIWREGCVPLTVKFGQSLSDSLTNTYEWEFGDGTFSDNISPIKIYEDAGLYIISLRVITDKGCVTESGPSESYVLARPLPSYEIEANPIRTSLEKPTIYFNSTITGSWTFGDDSTAIGTNPEHTYQDTGSYKVVYTTSNSYGCIDSSILKIIIEPYYLLEIPNAFSPKPNGSNGGKYSVNDLSNDVFHPHTEGVEEYLLQIFTRWGELIFESNDIDVGWDGYYKGVLSQQEVYVWKISILWENGQNFKGVGDVTLFR